MISSALSKEWKASVQAEWSRLDWAFDVRVAGDEAGNDVEPRGGRADCLGAFPLELDLLIETKFMPQEQSRVVGEAEMERRWVLMEAGIAEMNRLAGVPHVFGNRLISRLKPLSSEITTTPPLQPGSVLQPSPRSKRLNADL